ncbi:hypothetical protein N9N00_04880 [Schleiferiaceae bacterium]|nr:hypothetical protein [Schleiferiaceae bacterium]
MRQLYIIRSVYRVTIGILLCSFLFNSCQKDYVDVGLDFRPSVRLTVPLLNQDLNLRDFGLDTIAYETIQAISIPLSSTTGIKIPFNLFNRSMSNRFQVSSNVINNPWGSIRRSHLVTSDSLGSFIQNSSLALAFNQAVQAGSTPPSITQAILKRNQISIGQPGQSYTSSTTVDAKLKLENIQNALIECQFQIVTPTDSIVSSVVTIPSGGTQNFVVQLSASGDLPMKLSLVSFSYTPLGPLDPGTPLFNLELGLEQPFTQFEAELDSAVWENSIIQLLYLDSLSIMAPRSEIRLSSNSSFLFNFSSNLGTPLRRTIINNGQVLADLAAVPGQTSQYMVGGKTLFGSRDTFEFQSIYYSLNTAIPSSVGTRQITTTDVHAFAKPSYSLVDLNFNLPLTARQSTASSLSVPLIDTAEFFDPILNVGIDSDAPYEVEFQLFGENYPNGVFQTDSLKKKLDMQSNGLFKESFTFDSSNSQLSALSSIPMDSLALAPKIKLISNGDLYAVTENSHITLTPELILPIQGKLSGFVFSDTLNLNLDTTLIHYALTDTIRLDFASRNPATLGIRLRIKLLDSLSNSIDDQSLILIEPSPFSANLTNGLTFVESKSSFFIRKAVIKKAKQLVYILEIGGDSDDKIRLPASGAIRLEANLVLP